MLKTRKLRPPFKCHGGKYYLAKWIINHFPRDYSRFTYVEPFAGGANVLLQKRRSPQEVLSDLDAGAVSILTALRDQPDEFVARLRALHYSEATFDEMRSRRPEALDGLDAAVVAYALRRMSRGGLQTHFAWSDRRRGGRPGDLNAWETALDVLPAISVRLQGVAVYNAPATTVIEEHDGPDTLVYADPPYLPSTRNAVKAYRHDMTAEDHAALANLLGRCRGRVVLSGYPSDLYAGLFRGWRSVSLEVANHAAQGRRKRRMTEQLWMNW
jgi:DNA adenine methylase